MNPNNKPMNCFKYLYRIWTVSFLPHGWLTFIWCCIQSNWYTKLVSTRFDVCPTKLRSRNDDMLANLFVSVSWILIPDLTQFIITYYHQLTYNNIYRQYAYLWCVNSYTQKNSLVWSIMNSSTYMDHVCIVHVVNFLFGCIDDYI